ncbi:beta-lactamase/transpeptidase-like protein [Trichoderma gracile]
MANTITKPPEDIIQDLDKAHADMLKIKESTGIVGLSAAVVLRDKVLWRANMGRKGGLKTGEPVNADTVFPLGALSQSFTAACIAQEVYRRGLSFDDKVAAHLPAVADKQATIGDLLGHRTGLQAPDHLLHMNYGGLFDDRLADAIQAFNDLRPVARGRRQFLHNSLGYALLGAVVDPRYHSYLQKNVLDPLQMTNTRMSTYARYDHGDTTRRYSALDHSRVSTYDPSEFSFHSDVKDASVAVGGMSSSSNDMAKYCIALNGAWRRRGPAGDARARKLRRAQVFPDVDLLFGPLQSMGDDAPDGTAKKSHAAGWVTCTLPAALGDVGINAQLMEMPILGSGCAPVTVVWNQSRYHGTNAFVALLPECEAAVIVLSNTMTANDAVDWIGQLLIQTLLDHPYPNNYPLLASVSAETVRLRYDEVGARIALSRRPGGPPRRLSQYCGCYKCFFPPYYMRVTKPRMRDMARLKGCLWIDLREVDGFPLQHLYEDTFTRFLPWEQRVKARLKLDYRPEYHLIRFQPRGDGGDIESLVWINDAAKPEGHVFPRISRSASYPYWRC